MARRNDPDAVGDPTRREFFRTFGRETVRNAGAVMGAASELRRASGVAARQLFEAGSVAGPTQVESIPPAATTPGYNSAYRLGIDELLLLDQRELPARAPILSLREPSEVASAMRLGAVNAGPVLGEVAAYAIAIAASRGTDARVAERDALISAAANTLRGARRDVAALSAAVDRMQARFRAETADSPDSSDERDRDRVTRALREEADRIAADAQVAHAALGRHGAELISSLIGGGDQPANLLIHGDLGPLSCGMVGTGTAILQDLLDRGRNVHVWLTEAAPGMEGSRIAALQLSQMDVPHTIIPDTAVSWLLGTRRLDAALLRGDTIVAGGATLSPIGSLNVARLAADAGMPVLVVAPGSSWVAEGVEPESLTFDLRSPAEVGTRETSADAPRPAVFGARLSPTTDILPPTVVNWFVTDSEPKPTGTG